MNPQLKITKIFQNRILQHVAFWIFYLIICSVLFGSQGNAFFKEMATISIQLPIEIIAAYFALYFLLPKYLLKQKYLSFFIIAFISTLVLGFAQRATNYYIIGPLLYPEEYKTWHFFNIPRISFGLIWIYLVTSIVVSIKLLKHWYKNQQVQQELEKQELETELKFLKNQIHPHFLFNTLNNLYSLILKKSDNAKDVVLKLSDLMSYMLHDAKAKLVVLSKEINYINNYIALEKIRFGNRFEISFNTFGNINKYQIPPLLILPFIENSFKHGVSGEIDGAWITIEISVEDEDFTLKIENSISDRTGTKSKNLTNSGIAKHFVRKYLPK